MFEKYVVCILPLLFSLHFTISLQFTPGLLPYTDRIQDLWNYINYCTRYFTLKICYCLLTLLYRDPCLIKSLLAL